MMTYTLTLSDFGQRKAVHIAFDGSNRIKPSMNEHKSPRSRHNLVSYRRYSCQESTKKLCIPGGSEQIIIWTMKPNKSVYNSLYPVRITVYIYYLDLSRRQLLRKSRPCVMPRLCILCKLQLCVQPKHCALAWSFSPPWQNLSFLTTHAASEPQLAETPFPLQTKYIKGPWKASSHFEVPKLLR